MVGAWFGQARLGSSMVKTWLGHGLGTGRAWGKVGAWFGHDRSMAPYFVTRIIS